MNERIKKLRQIVTNTAPEICIDRGVAITRSYQETEGLPIITRRALAFKRILQDMGIYILDKELIVGNQQCKPKAAPLFPEFGVRWIKDEIDSFDKRKLERFILPQEKKAAVLEMIEYWDGKTHQDYAIDKIKETLKGDVARHYSLATCSINQVLGNVYHTSNGDGHIIADYKKLLDVGVKGIKEQAVRNMEGLNNDDAKFLFLDAVIITCDAIVSFSHRFAGLALDLARDEKDEARKKELGEIARVCKTVPENPPKTLQEALQSFWFIHLGIQIESNGQSISFGRFDQLVNRFYVNELKEGTLTKERAVELLECFFLKALELNKVREWTSTEFQTGYNMFQTLTLGGQKECGSDATNEMSYLALEATADLKVSEPTTVVRIHENTPDEFFLAAIKTLKMHRGGLPAFFNDQCAIPLLLNLKNNDIKLNEARDWAIMGCVEPTIPGKFINSTGGTCCLNMAKVLEITLNKGLNPETGVCVHPVAFSINTYEDFLGAYYHQLEFYMDMVPTLMQATCDTYKQYTPTPFLSSYISNRIAYGRDILDGKGDSDYNVELMEVHGLATVADSLAAIRKTVFEEKRFTLDELRELTRKNFEGYERERQLLINHVPKYGNDEPCVDMIAKEVLSFVTNKMSTFTTPRGGCYGVSTQTTTSNVPDGRCVGATPDGRKAGEPLSDNNSPSPGVDAKGPTACMKSVGRLDHINVGMGTLFNMKFHPQTLKNDETERKFMSLIKTFFGMKAHQVQFNVISPETLMDAQRHPERYRDLVVKVAGYSARFTDLDKQLQDQLIARTTF